MHTPKLAKTHLKPKLLNMLEIHDTDETTTIKTHAGCNFMNSVISMRTHITGTCVWARR
jgi:hypothetical protein